MVVLVGPGNNGGDALILARHLSRDGAAVICWAARQRAADPLVRDAVSWGVRWKLWAGDPAPLVRDVAPAACVIDGLLGIGSAPPLRGGIGEMLAALPSVPGQTRIAIDIPSGTDADTGEADRHAFSATLTLSPGAIKLGSLLHPAIEFAGEIEALDIGLPEARLAQVPIGVLTSRTVRRLLPDRPSGGHKGTFGRLLIVGGSARYRGAPALAAIAAIGTGAGLVTVASVEPAVAAAAAAAPSATFLPLAGDRDGRIAATADEVLTETAPDALLFGPGLGRSASLDALAVVLARGEGAKIPKVIDADGLNALADKPEALADLGPQTVLTPHPGELRRLLTLDSTPAGAGRLDAARRLADRSGAVVVAKGSPTFVCAGSQAWVLARPNPALATAGTGDVLAGAIASLMTQSAAPTDAARLGVWLQARAAELAAADADAGVPADELAHTISEARAEL